MRRTHFDALRPVCPSCGRNAPLTLAHIFHEQDAIITHAILHCPTPSCSLEFPVIDSIPIITPNPAETLRAHGAELLLRTNLPAALESLLGDALGQESWLDSTRQMQSTYGWDAFAPLDPEEQASDGGPTPGAAARCAERLLALAKTPPGGRLLDAGCGAGGGTFAIAAHVPDALVLGIDLNPALLRLAHGAAAGHVSYPRRRIGLAYDRRSFPVDLPGAHRTDFWCCDATALPFSNIRFTTTTALNLLDCVPQPAALLAELARVTAPGGTLLLASPYDWSTRATGPGQWIGGHSQRAPHSGAAEPFLKTLITEGAHPNAVSGLNLIAEQLRFAWHTRLHDRSFVSYATHLLALVRLGE